MKMKRSNWIVLSVALFATLFLGGCWLFGITLVLSYDIEDKDFDTDEPLNGWLVDLTDEDDWKDNQDKLDEIYNLLFHGKIHNLESDTATGQLYVYKDTSLHTIAEVESLATLVLDGLAVPPGDTLEVPIMEMKLEPIRDLIMEGKFGLYGIAKDTPFHIKVFDATVVVIFAVEAIL